MKTMKTIEGCKNIVELLKQALNFYANEENYKVNVKPKSVSMIEIDEGSQARFALTKANEFNETIKNLEADYLKNMGDTIDDDSTEKLLKIIESYKNMVNGDKK